MDSQRTLGTKGSIWCHDTLAYAAPTGQSFCAITFTEATVFATLTQYTSSYTSASTALASFTFAAGVTIYGNWTSWTLASGGLIAYKNNLGVTATG
jgi:uncharacterized membrane protein